MHYRIRTLEAELAGPHGAFGTTKGTLEGFSRVRLLNSLPFEPTAEVLSSKGGRSVSCQEKRSIEESAYGGLVKYVSRYLYYSIQGSKTLIERLFFQCILRMVSRSETYIHRFVFVVNENISFGGVYS